MTETYAQRLLSDADTINLDGGQRAALELLAWHDYWLRRSDFLNIAVRVSADDEAAISWHAVQEEFNRGGFDCASTSERAILDLAIALGTDRYRFNQMGDAHAAAIIRAVSTALGNPS